LAGLFLKTRKQSDKKYGDFVCPTCQIHFNQASNRKRHMAVSHEENEDQTPADPAFVAKVRAYNTKGRETRKEEVEVFGLGLRYYRT